MNDDEPIEIVLGDGPGADVDEGTVRLLRRLHVAVLRHPAAATALFNALVAEGRRYGETAEGAALVEALAASPSVRRAQALWEVMSAGVVAERPPQELPSALVDAFVRAAANVGLDDFLGRLGGRPR